MSHGLFGNNVALLTALSALAPELNVRMALINLIDFLSQLKTGDEIERDSIYEVIAQNIVWLHDHVGSEDEHDDDEDLRNATIEEAIAKFRLQLDNDEEEKDK